MLTDHTIKFNKLLTPFSFLYGIGVRFRNQLFDWKVLRTERYDLPIICVGNLTVGGPEKLSYGIHHPFDKRPIPGSCTQPWL